MNVGLVVRKQVMMKAWTLVVIAEMERKMDL